MKHSVLLGSLGGIGAALVSANIGSIKGLLALTLVTFFVGGCVKDDDDAWLVKARQEVPFINGGFSFTQYVVVHPGDPEVIGDKGVLYISPHMLSEDQLKEIANSPAGKKAIYGDEAATYFGLINTCLADTAVAPGKAGVAAPYLSLVLTGTTTKKDSSGVRMRLYTWPDFWYDWEVKQEGSGFAVDDSSTTQAFEWTSSRVVLIRDPGVTLQTCLATKG